MGKNRHGFNQPFQGLTKVMRPAAKPETVPPHKHSSDTQPSTVPAPKDAASLFAQAVADITPLEGRERRQTGAPKYHERVAPKSEDDEALSALTALVNGESAFEVHDAEEFLYGVAPGVNRKLLGELRRGNHAYRRHLDLHGYSRNDAKSALVKFIVNSRRQGERCVLVITGRGRKSPGGISVLRESVPRWLSRHPAGPHVLAFCSARNVDGGAGAFYVLLRRLGVKPFGG